MTEELVVNEPIAGVNSEAVTETETPEAPAEGISESQPKVEIREGKTYVDGKRVYTRDDTNQIAARARNEVQSQLLNDLGVDDLDQVKSVISSLQQGGNDLNVEAMQNTIRKREATVEELQAELAELKTQTVMRDHISNIRNAMPQSWNSDQQDAVIDLMQGRNMLELQDSTFAIRHNGELLLDESGESPNYAEAVRVMGKTLGLPMSKSGIQAVDAEATPSRNSDSGKPTDEKLKDPAYRAAYVAIRNSNRNLSRSEITDGMIKKQMESTGVAGRAGMLVRNPQPTTKSKRK